MSTEWSLHNVIILVLWQFEDMWHAKQTMQSCAPLHGFFMQFFKNFTQKFSFAPKLEVASVPRAIFVLSKEDLAFPKANAVRNRTKSGANVRMAASQLARIVVQFAQRYVVFYLIAHLIKFCQELPCGWWLWMWCQQWVHKRKRKRRLHQKVCVPKKEAMCALIFESWYKKRTNQLTPCKFEKLWFCSKLGFFQRCKKLINKMPFGKYSNLNYLD